MVRTEWEGDLCGEPKGGKLGWGMGNGHQGRHGVGSIKVQCCLVPVLRARASLSSIFFSSSSHPTNTALTC